MSDFGGADQASAARDPLSRICSTFAPGMRFAPQFRNARKQKSRQADACAWLVIDHTGRCERASREMAQPRFRQPLGEVAGRWTAALTSGGPKLLLDLPGRRSAGTVGAG